MKNLDFNYIRNESHCDGRSSASGKYGDLGASLSILPWRVALLGALCLCFAVGCGFRIPPDSHGASPTDVLNGFVRAVQQRDYDQALQYWNTDVEDNLDHNSALTFNEFCEKYFQCDAFVLSAPYRGKSGHVFIDFEGTLGGRIKRYSASLKMVEERWILIEKRLAP